MAGGGSQHTTHKVFQWVWVVVLMLMTAGLLGGAIVLGANALNGTAPGDDDEALAAAIFLLVLAGVCAPFTYLLLRKVMPRKAKHLSVSVQRPTVRRGEEVVARLDVLDPSEIAGTIDVALRCIALYEESVQTNNGTSMQTRERVVHEQSFEALGTGPQEFRFQVSPDGPFSYAGTYLSMLWKVVARDREPRRSDRTLEQPVEVLP